MNRYKMTLEEDQRKISYIYIYIYVYTERDSVLNYTYYNFNHPTYN